MLRHSGRCWSWSPEVWALPPVPWQRLDMSDDLHDFYDCTTRSPPGNRQRPATLAIRSLFSVWLGLSCILGRGVLNWILAESERTIAPQIFFCMDTLLRDDDGAVPGLESNANQTAGREAQLEGASLREVAASCSLSLGFGGALRIAWSGRDGGADGGRGRCQYMATAGGSVMVPCRHAAVVVTRICSLQRRHARRRILTLRQIDHPTLSAERCHSKLNPESQASLQSHCSKRFARSLCPPYGRLHTSN